MSILLCVLLVCEHTRDEGGAGEMVTQSLSLFYTKQGSCIISRWVNSFPIGRSDVGDFIVLLFHGLIHRLILYEYHSHSS